MVLVIGGAFQGKLDFAKEKFNINDEMILDFSKHFTRQSLQDSFCEKKENADLNETILNDKSAIYGLHHLVRYVIENSFDINILYGFVDYLQSIENKKIIIISDDVSNCLVPIDKVDRQYREELSKLLCSIAKKSEEVYRVFVGIPEKIK